MPSTDRQIPMLRENGVEWRIENPRILVSVRVNREEIATIARDILGLRTRSETETWMLHFKGMSFMFPSPVDKVEASTYRR